MTETWADEFDTEARRLRSNITADSGFSALLRRVTQSPQSPISAIQLTIEVQGGRPIILGQTINREPDHLATFFLSGIRHERVRFRLWFGGVQDADGSQVMQRATTLVRHIFDIWWMPDARSPKGDLPMWTDETKRRGQGALELQQSRSEPFTVLFGDLDNFKQVNNELGQAGGDEVIARLATFFEEIAADQGALVHHGGDEFVIVIPQGAEHDAIELAARLAISAQSFDFRTGNVPVGLSFGIASNSGYPSANFEELVKAADEDALKKLVKANSAVKGSMRVSGDPGNAGNWARDLDPRALAVVLKSSLGPRKYPFVFASVWLNALLKAGHSGYDIKSSLQDAADQILAVVKACKISLELDNVCYIPAEAGRIITPSLSAFDVAVALSRVILDVRLDCDEINGDDTIIIRGSGTTTTLSLGDVQLMEIEGAAYHNPFEVNLGPTWRLEKVDGVTISVESTNPSPFLLVEIGRNHLFALSRLAADHIVIDDRPTRAGGLPDFWELSLSRVIASLAKLPNVERVVVFGEQANAQETISKLKAADQWDLDYISYKTLIPKITVSQVQGRLLGRVAHFETEEDALESLIDTVCAPRTLHATKAFTENKPATLIRRTLAFPSAYLGPLDGCRVKTAAEAYPLMLEMLRAGGEPEDLIVDQDGIPLRELVDFKVVVDSLDHQEQIPWFFRNERDQLNSYFQRQFIESGGRFTEKLRLNGSEARILDHVAWALTRPYGRPFATRRALLVIPHEPAESPEALAPLGLVSVRLLPQPCPTGVVVNFSFTWRTVEALVGFPYSLFGSLRYALYLCDELRARCPQQKIHPGFLSYIAHSLHFFVSDEARRIARGIVNESSL